MYLIILGVSLVQEQRESLGDTRIYQVMSMPVSIFSLKKELHTAYPCTRLWGGDSIHTRSVQDAEKLASRIRNKMFIKSVYFFKMFIIV